MGSVSTELRQAVLQAAIQGKLTEQLPEDGNARDLIERINKVREHEIKTKKIRKLKCNSLFSEEDIPFDVPDNWGWIRFGQVVANFDADRRPVSKDKRINEKGLYPYYGATGVIDMVDDYLFDGEYLMIGEDGGNFFVDRDNSFIARGKFWANNHVHVVKPIEISIVYLKYFLDSCNLPAMNLITGIAVKKLNQDKMNSILVPLPPLAEQHRIVARVEELMAKIDELEVIENNLRELHQAFPNDMKASLLQAAMQGKLTEQLPEDDIARDLLKQIKSEKERLIKEGKIKKEKVLAPITEDEIPFDIPDNWEWVRLGFVGDLKNGYAFKSSEYVNNGIQVVRIADLGDNEILTSDAVYYSENDIFKPYEIKANSFLICMTGSIGKMARVNDNVKRYLNQRVGMYIPFDIINSDYIWKILHSNYVMEKWVKSKKSTNGNIKTSDILDLLIPLPPLAEQERIVEKLDRLLPLCDSIPNEL